jgi:outer membrane murein-binding lipoprotein Lpp
MTRGTHATWVAVVLAVLLLGGCQTNSRTQVLATTESQLALRQMQSRAFDTTDRNMMLRTVVATLQDLSFVIDEADAMIGSVSGTKLAGYRLRMTVSIRPRGETQLLVRANAQFNVKAVDDPEPYQQFFFALEKSLFLTAHQVD